MFNTSSVSSILLGAFFFCINLIFTAIRVRNQKRKEKPDYVHDFGLRIEENKDKDKYDLRHKHYMCKKVVLAIYACLFLFFGIFISYVSYMNERESNVELVVIFLLIANFLSALLNGANLFANLSYYVQFTAILFASLYAIDEELTYIRGIVYAGYLFFALVSCCLFEDMITYPLYIIAKKMRSASPCLSRELQIDQHFELLYQSGRWKLKIVENHEQSVGFILRNKEGGFWDNKTNKEPWVSDYKDKPCMGNLFIVMDEFTKSFDPETGVISTYLGDMELNQRVINLLPIS